jgi:hypothetical protein
VGADNLAIQAPKRSILDLVSNCPEANWRAKGGEGQARDEQQQLNLRYHDIVKAGIHFGEAISRTHSARRLQSIPTSGLGQKQVEVQRMLVMRTF